MLAILYLLALTSECFFFDRKPFIVQTFRIKHVSKIVSEYDQEIP